MVIAAVRRDIDGLVARDPSIEGAALAAVALVLAAELDKTDISATAKSMCAKSLMDALERLREMVPARVLDDAVDDLTARRDERIAKAAQA